MKARKFKEVYDKIGGTVVEKNKGFSNITNQLKKQTQELTSSIVLAQSIIQFNKLMLSKPKHRKNHVV